MIYDVIIVGAGPAGMTAAIYLKRANINCLIIEKDTPGGQVVKSSVVENYPGFLTISGPDLANNFYKQIKNLQVPYKYGEVKEIVVDGDDKIIRLGDEELKAKKVILAIGRSPLTLNTESDSLRGKGVSYCSLCDGSLYKNCDVAIVGGGNTALEEAIYLSSICKTVTIINRSNKLRGEDILIDKISNVPNIKVLFNTTVDKFNKDGDVLSSLDLLTNGVKNNIKVKACFIFVGYAPATKFLENLAILDDKGYIIVNEQMETNVDGIYACGDVVKKNAYQIATAVGEGAICATACIKKLN